MSSTKTLRLANLTRFSKRAHRRTGFGEGRVHRPVQHSRRTTPSYPILTNTADCVPQHDTMERSPTQHSQNVHSSPCQAFLRKHTRVGSQARHKGECITTSQSSLIYSAIHQQMSAVHLSPPASRPRTPPTGLSGAHPASKHIRCACSPCPSYPGRIPYSGLKRDTWAATLPEQFDAMTIRTWRPATI